MPFLPFACFLLQQIKFRILTRLHDDFPTLTANFIFIFISHRDSRSLNFDHSSMANTL